MRYRCPHWDCNCGSSIYPAIPPDTSPIMAGACCSAATPSFRQAAAGCLKVRQSRCAAPCSGLRRCPMTLRCSAGTNTPKRICSLPSPWSREMSRQGNTAKRSSPCASAIAPACHRPSRGRSPSIRSCVAACPRYTLRPKHSRAGDLRPSARRSRPCADGRMASKDKRSKTESIASIAKLRVDASSATPYYLLTWTELKAIMRPCETSLQP